MTMWKSLCFALVFSYMIFLNESANPSPEQELIRSLLTGHNHNARPVLRPNTTITVEFGLEIVQIIDVDTRFQTIKTNVWIRQRWKNDILHWNTSGYEGVRAVRLEPKAVWTPDIVLYNSADSDSSSGIEKFKTHVIIKNDGTVAWFSPALYITTCSIDITYFPFDQQTCVMKFGSWTFMETEVDVVPSAKAISSDKYIESTEWEMIAAWKQRQIANYTCCEKPLSFIEIKVMIRRRPLFYAFNLIAPCMIFMSVILLGFCLPPESRERITLNITVLLAMAVFMQLMAKSLPRNADTTPLLGRFYITIMAQIALSLVGTCFVLNLHHRNMESTSGFQIPTWVEVVVLHWLAAVLCVRRPVNEFESWNHRDIEKIGFKLTTNHKPECAGDISKPTMNGHAQGASLDVRKYHTKITINEGLPLTTFMRSRSLSSRSTNDQSTKDLSVLSVLARRHEMAQQSERRNLKWKLIAMVMDRLLFWIFVVTIVITTSAVFKERIRQSFGED